METREIWDLYDKDNAPLNETHVRGKTIPKGRYHRIVEAWIKTKDGKIILQKRSKHKKSYPGYWSCTACGSVLSEEAPNDAMIREMREEMGIDLKEEELVLDRIITEYPAHYYIYRIEKDVKEEDIVIDPEEVEDVIFLNREELENFQAAKHMLKMPYYRDFFKNW